VPIQRANTDLAPAISTTGLGHALEIHAGTSRSVTDDGTQPGRDCPSLPKLQEGDRGRMRLRTPSAFRWRDFGP